MAFIPYNWYAQEMAKESFEWDADKDLVNQIKHEISFAEAQYVFADPCRVIAKDLSHSEGEERYYCFGKVGNGVITVRFTYRHGIIRIFGAGYWRRGKRIYEHENQIFG